MKIINKNNYIINNMFEYPIGHIFSQKDDNYIVEIAQKNFMCDLC